MNTDKEKTDNGNLPIFSVVGSTCLSLKCNKEIDEICTHFNMCKYQKEPYTDEQGRLRQKCMLAE